MDKKTKVFRENSEKINDDIIERCKKNHLSYIFAAMDVTENSNGDTSVFRFSDFPEALMLASSIVVSIADAFDIPVDSVITTLSTIMDMEDYDVTGTDRLDDEIDDFKLVE